MLGRNARRPFAGLAALLPLGCAPAAVGVVLATSDGGSSSRGAAGGSAVTAPVVSYRIEGYTAYLGPGPRSGGHEFVARVVPALGEGQELRIGGRAVELIEPASTPGQGSRYRVRGPLPPGEAPVTIALGTREVRWDRQFVTQYFRRAARLPSITGAYRLAAVDLEGDGDDDLIVTKSDGNPAVLLRNDRTAWATLGEVSDWASREFTADIRKLDVDGDGRFDLVAVSNYTVTTFRNRGDGTIAAVGSLALFERFPNGGAGSASGSALVALDVDRDGRTDVVVLTARGLFVLTNNGGVLVETGMIRRETNARLLWAGDLDGDGDLDLVAGGHSAAPLVARNDGHGAFNFLPSLPSCEVVAVFDLDGDGDLDLLGVNGQVLENQGGMSFVDRGQGHSPTRAGHGAALVGDLSRDGTPDLVEFPSLDTWLFQGAGRPPLHAGQHRWFYDPPLSNTDPPRQVLIGPRDAVLLDVDADGDLDLAVLGSDGIWILVND